MLVSFPVHVGGATRTVVKKIELLIPKAIKSCNIGLHTIYNFKRERNICCVCIGESRGRVPLIFRNVQILGLSPT